MPTYWDETRVLSGEVGEALVTARRKGRVWYVGGMVAGKARDVNVPLSFLGPERYTAKIWRDSPETESDPNHLTTDSTSAKASESLRVHVSSDGGFVAVFTAHRK